MGAALLQHHPGNATAGVTSINIVFPSAVTPGSLLVCYIGTTAANRTLTVSDSVNGSYTQDVLSTGGAGSTSIFTFPNTAAGTPTVTLTMSGAVGELDGIIEEWSGVLTVSPKDQTASNSGVTVNTGTTGTTAALAQANDLCLALMHTAANAGASYAVQSPFTADPDSPVPSSGGILLAVGNLVQTSTAGVSATFNWTNNQSFRSCISTYKTVQLGQLAPLYSRKYVLFNT